MAVLNDAQTVGAPFGNQSKYVSVEYDFANDAGGIDDYDVIVADGPMLVQLINIDVESALTSAGALVVDLGKGAGGVEFLSDKAVADFALDAQLPPDTVGTFVELADGEKIVMGLEAAAATAGKFHMMFNIYKRPK